MTLNKYNSSEKKGESGRRACKLYWFGGNGKHSM